ncbi:MAG: gamma carbonic anhydrase family protein [Candidatus Bathyarchaeia archaeon]
MSLVEFKGRKPQVHDSVFLAPDSWIIGDVKLEAEVNIWTGAIIRGDDDKVRVGKRTTVLENSIIEAPEGLAVVIGDNTIISHGATVHGAKIGNRVLIGIGAIVLDGSEIGDGSIIGSGALVPPKAVIPPNSLALGIPAKVVRKVKEEERANVVKEHKRTTSKALKYKRIYEEGKP